jgi:hypothetical protein
VESHPQTYYVVSRGSLDYLKAVAVAVAADEDGIEVAAACCY